MEGKEVMPTQRDPSQQIELNKNWRTRSIIRGGTSPKIFVIDTDNYSNNNNNDDNNRSKPINGYRNSIFRDRKDLGRLHGFRSTRLEWNKKGTKKKYNSF